MWCSLSQLMIISVRNVISIVNLPLFNHHQHHQNQESWIYKSLKLCNHNHVLLMVKYVMMHGSKAGICKQDEMWGTSSRWLIWSVNSSFKSFFWSGIESTMMVTTTTVAKGSWNDMRFKKRINISNYPQKISQEAERENQFFMSRAEGKGWSQTEMGDSVKPLFLSPDPFVSLRFPWVTYGIKHIVPLSQRGSQKKLKESNQF